MIKIQIESELKEKCPELMLGCIYCKVKTTAQHNNLWEEINAKIIKLSATLSNEAIRKMDSIHSSKQGYKSLGKDPNRYRPSAESLLRRLVNGKGLYQINNVVDLLNLVSISTGFSIGGYDADKIKGEIRFGIGKTNENYEGIGRGKLNIENLPMLRDDMGAFGSPTSDSIRTQVGKDCTKFLMIIISFQGKSDLQASMNLAEDLLHKYADAKETTTWLVE